MAEPQAPVSASLPAPLPTWAQDIVWPRVGIGTDVHAFAPEGAGRVLWIAGLA